MTIIVTQICDKCKKERTLDKTLEINPQLGGWRQLDGRDICPDCLKKVFDS